MTKKLKIYQVLTFALGLAFVGLCLFVGITAVQKSMKLNLAVKMNPSILCGIYVDDTLVFDNVNSTIGDGVELTANTLKLNSTSTFGQSFNLKIANKNANAIYVTFSGATISGSTSYSTVINASTTSSAMALSSAGTVTITMQQVVQVTTNIVQCTYTTDASSGIIEANGKKYIPYGGTLKQTFTSNAGYSTPPTLSVTMGGETTTAYTYTNGVFTFSNVTADIVVNASCNPITYTVAYNANGGSGSIASQTHTYGISLALSPCTFTAPANKKFAGWATTANGSVVYTDEQSVSNLKNTQGATITLYAVWENLGYTVTFATNNWNAKVGGQETTSIVVEKNGSLTATLAGSGTQEGYSVHTAPTISGTVTSSTFDRYTGSLTLTNIQSDLTISATDFRPWTYGTYTNDNTKFPDITSKQNGTVNTGKVWEGYTYIQMANYETQESNYKKSSAGDIPARWIIIGCGDDLTASFFPTSLTNSFADIKTSAGETQEDGKPNPNPYLRDTSGNKTATKELASDEILLLSEQTLISDYYDDNGSGDWTSDSTSNLRYDLNNETDTGFFKKSGLHSYISYMTQPTLYTAWATTETENTHGGATIDTSSYIFLLGSRYGWLNTNGQTPQEGGEARTLQRFLAQSFCAEDYLGSYNKSTSSNSYANNNDRMFAFGGSNPSHWWLRSGHYHFTYNSYDVINLGYVGSSGVNLSSRGVRPSFVLNLA